MDGEESLYDPNPKQEDQYQKHEERNGEGASLLGGVGGDDAASTDSLDTTATRTNRSLISRVNDTFVATQVHLHERVSDWGVRTENILALFWGGIIFFVGLSFNIAQSNTGSLSDNRFATIYWVLFAFMLFGILFMAIAINNRDNENIYYVLSEEERRGNGNIKMLEFLTRCVFTFALGVSLLDIMALVNVFHCGYGDGNIDGSTETNQYTAILMFHISRLLYTSLQLVLLQILVGSRVRRSGYYQFCMKLLCVHVIVTNVSLWLTKFNEETGLFGDHEPTGEYDALNCTTTSEDSFFPIAKAMDSRLYSFLLEFCLLSSALFYTLFPFLAETKRTAQLSSGGGVMSSGGNGTVYGGYKYQSVSITKDVTERYRTFPSLIVGFGISLLLVVASWNMKDAAQLIQNMRFNYVVQILVFIFLIVVCRVVLFQMKENHRSIHTDQNYKIEDILLILSGPLGSLPFCLLVLFASFAYKKEDHLNEVFVTKNETEIRIWSAFWAVTFLLSVFIQTHFLIVGRNFRRDIVAERVPTSSSHSSSSATKRGSNDSTSHPIRRIDEEDEEADTVFKRKIGSAPKISQLVIVIMLINFGMWFLESFFETDAPFAVASAYWGHHAWLIITKLLYPFIVFYRFHSVAVLMFIWGKFKVK